MRTSDLIAGLTGGWLGVSLVGLLAAFTMPRWVWVMLTLVVVAALTAGTAQVVRWWAGFHRSPAQVRDDLLGRPGVADARQVERSVGVDPLLAQAPRIRPGLATPAPWHVGWRAGTSRGVDVWLSAERPEYLVGPPRSGKGRDWLIAAIVEAPGAVVSTSTRADNMEATIQARSRIGPVALFDPEGVTGRTGTLRWSPIIGCEDPRLAQRHAIALVRATGLAEGDNAPWAATAGGIVQALLHAAAVGQRTIHDVHRWAQSPTAAMEAMRILQASRSVQSWDETLEALRQAEARMQASRFFGVTEAFRALDVREVRETFDVAPGEPCFDPARFLTEAGTLYMVSRWRSEASKEVTVGGFMAMLLDDITEAARGISQRRGSRLDPPCTLLLDEIANTFYWDRLPQVMSAGSGEGLKTIVAFQSRAQARASYGRERETSMWDAGARVLLGGSVAVEDLAQIAQISGEREVTHTNRSTTGQQWLTRAWSEQTVDKPVLSVSDLQRLPEGVALLLHDRTPPIVVDIEPWPTRAWASQVTDSVAWHQANLPSPDRPAPAWH